LVVNGGQDYAPALVRLAVAPPTIITGR